MCSRQPHARFPRTPTQGKAFAVVTLTKPKSETISRGPIDVYRSAIAPKKPSPSRAQRDARSAYKIDRDAAGGVVDLVRLSGAKEHRFSRSDRPLWLAPPASSARRSAPSTGCGWKHLPPPPSARARACAAGFSRSAVAPSRFAIRRVVTALNSNHHTLSQSIRLHAGWPSPVASERREPREPDLDAATGLLPSRSRSRFAPQASVGPPLLVRECDDLNSEPSGFPLRADPLEARITPIRTATERQRRSTVSGSQSPEPRRSGSDGAPFLDVLYAPIRSPCSPSRKKLSPAYE